MLNGSANAIAVIKDSLNAPYIKVTVNAASLRQDPTTRLVLVSDVPNASQYAIVALPSDPTKPMVRDGFPLAVLQPNQNPPINNPVDTTKPINNQPVAGDTSKPVPYKGSLDNLKTMLSGESVAVKVASPNGATSAKVNPVTLRVEGDLTVATDMNNPSLVYVFMAPSADPKRVLVGPDGTIVVTLMPGLPPPPALSGL
jgi:hypothetical protein